MHTKQIQIPAAGRRRVRLSEAFKTQVVTAARQHGVSTAAVALVNGLNANLLRRWISEADAPRPMTRSTTAAVTATAQRKRAFDYATFPGRSKLGMLVSM